MSESTSNRSQSTLAPLIAAARGGDEAARNELLQAVVPQIQAYVRLNASRLVLSREWSLDVAQSVCIDALSGIDGFLGESDKQFRRWLFTIALNKIRSRHRYLTAGRRDVRLEKPIEAPAGQADTGDHELATVYSHLASPTRNLSVRETLARTEEAMERLSEEQRQVLTMWTILGLSHAEIAEHLGKAEPAVRKMLSRARARLCLLMAVEDGHAPAD